MSHRVIIGIAGQSYAVSRPFGELDVDGASHACIRAVIEAGAVPLILPLGVSHDAADSIDGLVLAGGGDVDPTLYGPAHLSARDVDPQRDRHEIALVHMCRAKGIPTLGICRGAQVMAIAFGATLLPDLADRHPPLAPPQTHPIAIDHGTLLAAALPTQTAVNSLHHQSIEDPGPAWRIAARAPDGVIEAIEWPQTSPAAWPAVGVQWHPELEPATGTGSLFAWLAKTAQATTDRSLRRSADAAERHSAPQPPAKGRRAPA